MNYTQTPFMTLYEELSALNDENTTETSSASTLNYTDASKIVESYYQKLITACRTINQNVGIKQDSRLVNSISASSVLLCLDSQNLTGLSESHGLALRYPAAGGGRNGASLHILTQDGEADKRQHRLKGTLRLNGSFDVSQSWLIFCIRGDDAIINASVEQIISLLEISTSNIKPQIITSLAPGLRSAMLGHQQGPHGNILIGVPYKATSAKLSNTFCRASAEVDALVNNSTNEIYQQSLDADWATNFLKNLLNYKAPADVQVVYYDNKAMESDSVSAQIDWPKVAIYMPTLIEFYVACLKTSQANLVKGQLKAFLNHQSGNRITIGPIGDTPHHSLQYLYNGMKQEMAIYGAKISGLARNGGATQLQAASDETKKYQYLVSSASRETDFIISGHSLDAKVLKIDPNDLNKSSQEIKNTHKAEYVICFAIDGLNAGRDGFTDTPGTWLLFKKQENSSNSTSYDKIVKATNECEENILNAFSNLDSTLPFVKLSN